MRISKESMRNLCIAEDVEIVTFEEFTDCAIRVYINGRTSFVNNSDGTTMLFTSEANALKFAEKYVDDGRISPR